MNLRTSGRFSTQLKHQNQSMEVDWLAVDNVKKRILGVVLCKKWKLVHQNIPFCEVHQVKMSPQIKLGHGQDLDIVALKYPEVFCGKIHRIHDKPATVQLILVPSQVASRSIRIFQKPTKNRLNTNSKVNWLKVFWKKLKMQKKQPGCTQLWLCPATERAVHPTN